MSEAVLDSNVLYAFWNERDQFHDPSQEIVHSMDSGELPRGIVTSLCLPEVLKALETDMGSSTAVECLDRLQDSRGFEITYLPKQDFLTALGDWRSLFGIEFTDVTTVRFMRSRELEYIYSFDDDFDDVDGVTRLNTAVNPFEP
jgi:predicted nucleic acid-binding protein